MENTGFQESSVFLFIDCKLKKIVKKNPIVPNEVLSKEFLSP